jgi:excisionase family DNA binding protein
MNNLTLSVPEAAAQLGVSERYMYELLRRSDCTFGLHLGRKIRIVRSELEKYVLAQAASYAATRG